MEAVGEENLALILSDPFFLVKLYHNIKKSPHGAEIVRSVNGYFAWGIDPVEILMGEIVAGIRR